MGPGLSMSCRFPLPATRGCEHRRSAIQRVDHADLCVDLDGLPIQYGGPVTPLANRSERGSIEERIARHSFKRLDRAIRCNDGVELHAALAVHLQRQPWIDRFHAMNQRGGFDMAEADALFLSARHDWQRLLRTSIRPVGNWRPRGIGPNRHAWNIRARGLVWVARWISVINGHNYGRVIGRHAEPAGRWSSPLVRVVVHRGCGPSGIAVGNHRRDVGDRQTLAMA